MQPHHSVSLDVHCFFLLPRPWICHPDEPRLSPFVLSLYKYPKLRAKYGESVRYAEDHSAHLKMEFGFDMVQVGKNRYASDQYHDFIGFQVSKPESGRATSTNGFRENRTIH